MAETAKSMNFRADATLVGAAGVLAREMGPRDMTGSFDKVIEARGELLETMEKNFKSTLKNIDSANAELKETMEVLNKKLNNGDLTGTEREELQLKMEDYRSRMKAIPRGKKGKKQRDDLMYEINREIKTSKNRDEAITDVLGSINNDQYDPAQLAAPYINFLEQIAKDGAEEETDPGFSKTKDESGETIYSYTYIDGNGDEQVIEADIYDIQKKINGTKKDYEFIKNQNEVIFQWEEYAKKNPHMKFEDIYNKISREMETSFNISPDKFKSIINHSMGWSDKSYVETLRDTNSDEFKSIIKALDNMNADEFDFDGDGSITNADFVTEENINTMIKALTDPDAAQRRVAHKVAAKFYADTEARKAFNFGVQNRPVDPNEPTEEVTDDDAPVFTGATIFIGNQQKKVTEEEQEFRRKMINDRESGWRSVNGDKYTWHPAKGGELGYFTRGNKADKLSPWDVANFEEAHGGHGSDHPDWQQVVNKARGHIDKLQDFEGSDGEKWTFVKTGANKGRYYDANIVSHTRREYLSLWDLAKLENATEGDSASAFVFTPAMEQEVANLAKEEKGLLYSDLLASETGQDDSTPAAKNINEYYELQGSGLLFESTPGALGFGASGHSIQLVDTNGNVQQAPREADISQKDREFYASIGFKPGEKLIWNVTAGKRDKSMKLLNTFMQTSVLAPYVQAKIDKVAAGGGGLELDEE